MSGLFIFLIFLICYQVQNLSLVSSANLNSLNGQHLQVIWPRWKGNPKGLTGPPKGGEIIDFLANRFDFTYEMVRITENRLEPKGKERGLFNYLWENKSDLLVIGVVLTFERFKVVDLTTPMAFESYKFLIPVQDDAININAVIKPFQWPVWLGLVVSTVAVIIFLQLLEFFLDRFSLSEIAPTNEEKPNRQSNIKNQKSWIHYVRRIGKHYTYVFGNLMSQGGLCSSKRLPLRLVAGVWCLAAFIFVQSYTSILFTYVVAPVNHPLINSVYDIVDRNDIQLLTRKGSTLNVLISDPNATEIFLKLKNKLKSFPNSQCNLVSECISLVTPGSRNTFVDGSFAQLEAIKGHYDQTKKCDLQLASESFLTGFASLALQKHSRYTDIVSKGVMELQQSGLMTHWDLWFYPIPRQCMANFNGGNKKTKTKHSSITLKNLTGAFVVILIGFSLSFLAFLCELIFSIAQCQIQVVTVPNRYAE